MPRLFRSIFISFPILVGSLLLLVGCSDPEARFGEEIERAGSLIEEGRYDEAIEVLNALNEQFPDRGRVLNEMGRAYEGAGEGFFAGLFYEQAGRADPNYGESLFAAARFFRAEGDRSRALAVIDDYLELYPDDAEAWRFSGELLGDSRRFQSALSAHLRAERLDGPARNPEYAATMGELYLHAGNLAQAEAHFQTALDEAPGDRFRALMGLLGTTYRREDYPRAEEVLNLLNEEFPGAVESSALAIAQEQILVWRLQQEALAEQIAALEDRTEVEGSSSEANATVGEEPASSGESEDSVQDGLAVDPQGGGKFAGIDDGSLADGPVIAGEEPEPEPEPLPPPPPPEPSTFEKAVAAREEGDFDAAVSLFWKAVQETPEDSLVWAELSKTYLMEGDSENAEIAILEALRRDPESLQYTLSYLNVVQQSRSRSRFMEELENAYNRIPNSPDIVLAMARAYAQPGGNPANAAYFYREFLEMAPSHPEVVAARRELNALP